MTFFTKLKNWWNLKLLEKEVNKEVDQNVNMWFNKPVEHMAEHNDDVQQKYYNGVTLMKRRIRESAGQNIDRFMSNFVGNDMLYLATDEDQSRKSLRELKESVYVFKGADIKTEEDKTKMIDTRINHYYDLQKSVTSRQLLRQARAAYNNGDTELHQKLMKEWDNQYGKSRNNPSRN